MKDTLAALDFVKGAVAKKDFVPVLTHVSIKDGYIQAYNGIVTLCSPIDLALDCTPVALKFIKAIQTCRETVQMSITPTGRLSIKSKGFKTLVECSPTAFPSIELEGERLPLPGAGFIQALKILEPLIAEDASRPWARGILFSGKTATATNNVVVAQLWLDFKFPIMINLPHMAVNELIRIKKEPVEMIVANNHATFIYDDGRWLRSQLNETKWPDINGFFKNRVDAKAQAVPEGFFDALRDIAPFVDAIGRAHIMPGKVSTSTDIDLATSVEVEGLDGGGIYNVSQLLLLEGIADKLNFTAHPAPAVFYGGNLRGSIIGMNM